MLKIKKGEMKEADCIGIGETWITQGHWMVKKEFFDHETQNIFKSDDTFIAWLGKRPQRVLGDNKPVDEMCNDIIGRVDKDTLNRYEKTDWINGKCQLFIGDNDYLFIDMAYVKSLELEDVFAMDKMSLCMVFDDKKEVIKAVMPMRHNVELPTICNKVTA